LVQLFSEFNGKGSERQKSERQKSKKNVESLRVDRKFEKDQNVKNEEVDQNVKNQNVKKNVESQK
jgi:hypothetical protein